MTMSNSFAEFLDSLSLVKGLRFNKFEFQKGSQISLILSFILEWNIQWISCFFHVFSARFLQVTIISFSIWTWGDI